ncbi:nucleotidyltransferase domain-containing protein [Haloimpatiens sp. FM7330]|uniref:nucleotidyltransferase domain-containing protein n=1 Tax=Haloimpatiens sp. FM7330 TaxID=3298610 RepID=UPI00362BEDD0
MKIHSDFDINYPSVSHKKYIECVYEFCRKNRFSMILRGSLSKGTATKYSDIDLIILGNIRGSKIDEVITLYDKPIMTNFTERPKGILILIYKDTISVDLDIRETISKEDLRDSKILLKYDENFIISDKTAIRKEIISKYIPNRPMWYKTLRLVHKGTIKYLSNKTDSAYNLLSEIKESLTNFNMNNLKLNGNFEDDIQCIFNEFCEKFEVDLKIKILFEDLFNKIGDGSF